MTLLEINLTDVLSETDPDDRVLVWAPAFREGLAGGLVGPRQKAIPLVDGVGSDEVLPGPLMVQVRCKAMSDTHPREVVVPETGPVTLTALFDSAGAFTYAPPVIGQVALDAQRAKDAAVRAESVAESTHWQDDRLSVMGQLGPPLTGPKGDKGDRGAPGDGAGDVLWAEIGPVLSSKADLVDGLVPTSQIPAPASHTHPAADIADATTVGRNVLKAATAAAARTAIGAGTSNLALGTTAATAAAGNHTHTGYATTAQVNAKVTGVGITAIEVVTTMPGTPNPTTFYIVKAS